MTLSRLTLAVAGAMLFSVAAANSTDELKAFPAAEDNEVRYVIELPQLADEYAAKVQLIAGKTIEVDCNNHRFGGEISEENLEGWGYNFYKVSELTGPMSTLMGCSEDSKHEEFVTMSDMPLIRYNSKLPIVIYAPKDVTVKYKIWQADVLEMEATKQ